MNLQDNNQLKKYAAILTLWLLVISSSYYALGQSEVNVDHLSGRAKVYIPLASVSSTGLSCSVGLAYSGGGMKVSDGEGAAGVGWNLVGGGAVRREMRSLPDDYEVPNETVKRGRLSGGLNDIEPDIFHFNGPGLSGKFILDALGVPKLAPYQDLKITYTRDIDTKRINQFQITTNQGVSYRFSEVEQSERISDEGGGPFELDRRYFQYSLFPNEQNFRGARYNSAWFLSEVLHPNGGTLNFSYQPFSNNTYEWKPVAYGDGSSGYDSSYFIKMAIDSKLLSTVKAENSNNLFAIELNWVGNLLNSVSYKETNYHSERTFRLLYQTVKNPMETKAATKSFLKEIKEEVNCGSFPSYQFSYYNITFSTDVKNPEGTTDMPFTKRLPVDLWGYFTNRVGAGVLPIIYLKTSESTDGAERVRHDIKDANNNDLPGYVQLPGGFDRSVNPSYVHYGSLKRITKPSGGFFEIEYEPNTWYDATLQKNAIGNGVRTRSIRASDGDGNASNDIVTNFDYSMNGISSGKLTYPFVYALGGANLSDVIRGTESFYPDTELMYQRVTESIIGQGKTIYDFMLPAMYPSTSFGDWQAAEASSGTVSAGFFTFPFAPSTNYDFERGLPERVTTFKEGRTIPLTERIFSYQRLNGPGGATTLTASRYGVSSYKWLLNTYKTILAETTRTYDPNSTTARYNESITTYMYSDTLAMPRMVTTTNSDGVINQSISKYAKDYNATGATDMQSTMIAQLQSSNRHGTLIESYNKVAGAVVSASLTMLDKIGYGGSILPKQQLRLASPIGFTVSKIQSGLFSYANASYYPARIVERYDNVGNVLASTDQQRNRQSFHYGYKKSLPVVSISQAKPEEVVYTDFETSTGYEMSYPSADLINNDRWSGKNALTLKAGVNLERLNVGKGNRYYIFSCRVKVTTATNVNLSVLVLNGATTKATGSVTYAASASGKWQYLETTIDLNAVTTGYTFRVNTPTQLLIDDIAFYPINSTIVADTYDPLFGKTSTISLRGVGTYTIYDALGRVSMIKDRNQNVISKETYNYASPSRPSPNSAFSASIPFNAITVNVPITFTSQSAGCVGNITYAWYVDGVAQSNAPVFTYTFTQQKDYNVKLVAYQAVNGVSATEETIMAKEVPHTLVTSLASGQSHVISNCPNDNALRTFNVDISGGSCPDYVIEWFYKPANSTIWKHVDLISNAGQLSTIINGGRTLNFYLLDFVFLQSYSIKCIVKSECTFVDEYLIRYHQWVSNIGSNDFAITYQYTQNCQ